MIPVIALVGRPNVGKSTLFNQLTRSRDALVANLPGLTRDRKYGEARMGSRRFVVIDTGGISGDEDGIDSQMAGQSLTAIEEADAVLMIVDAREGLNPGDQALARHLRQRNKAFHLVVNKIDGLDEQVAASDFYALGIETLHGVAASHGRGVRAMIESVLATFPDEEAQPERLEYPDSIRVAVVGRPNVGKSTLVNRLLGEERVVVFDEPGTTRDSIYIDYERDGQKYTLIDTAGVRKRKNVRETVEKFSIVKTLKAIDDAHEERVAALEEEGAEDLEEATAESKKQRNAEMAKLSGKSRLAADALNDYASWKTLQEQRGDVENRRAGEHLEESFLGQAGHAIAPAVAPLGWDWRIGMAAIASFPAREVIVATLGTIFNLGSDQDEESDSLRDVIKDAKRADGTPLFTLATGLSIMVFFALCAQCAATLAVMRRETNSWKWPIASFLYMTTLAYFASLVTYQVAHALGA